MPDSPIRIKRYPNRRFYASHTSSYVSLADIEEMIRGGATVEIVDSQSGVDLTRAVLVQVIAERHPDKMAMFPTAMLHSMLRANDVMASFLKDYFRNSLSYLDYLQQHGASASLKQPMHWMKAWLERWSKPGGEESAPEGEVSLPEGQERRLPPEDEPMADRLERLERRLAELESQRQGQA